jgi:hypothetical protein
MEQFFNKAKAIQDAVKAYQNDPNLSYRAAAIIHGCVAQSVIDHNIDQKIYASDRYAANQKLSPTKEGVLVAYIKKAYSAGYSLGIRHLNEFANELLRMRDFKDTVGRDWYTSFFRRYPEVYIMFSRPIDYRRVNAEDLKRMVCLIFNQLEQLQD